MNHVREILRLSRESGLSQNQISKALGISKGVVQKALSTFLIIRGVLALIVGIIAVAWRG